MTTLGLKNINMLSKDTYDKIAEPALDELYVVSSSGFGFPSNNYDDLELGATDTQYTAPASGWFYLAKKCSATGQYIKVCNVTAGLCANVSNNTASDTLRVNIICRKGDKFSVSYNAAGATEVFRFIYAEGE